MKYLKTVNNFLVNVHYYVNEYRIFKVRVVKNCCSVVGREMKERL